jgi:signal recognition particle receptor subunit beta
LNMVSQALIKVQNRLQQIATENEVLLAVSEPLELSLQLKENAIVICGELGRGKSSLIDALLERSLLVVNLPPSLSIFQSYPILITQEKPGSIKAHLAENKIVTLDLESLTPAQFEAWGSKLKWLDIRAEMPQFPIASQLIEAPNFGSADFETQMELLLEQLRYVVLVVDANRDLTWEDARFLKSLPASVESVIIVANNKLADAPSDNFERLEQGINTLRLSQPFELFEVSVQSAIANPENSDWQRLRTRLIDLAQAATEGSKHRPVKARASQMLKVAETLQAKIIKKAQSSTSRVTKSDQADPQRAAELRQRQRLIQDVIEDQADDILRTVRDSLEAFTFQLGRDLQERRKDPRLIQQELQQWLSREEQRVQTRLKRHFNSILDDTNYAVGSDYTLNVQLEEIRINRIESAEPPSAIEAFLAENPQLASISAGIATALATLPWVGRFFVSLSVGGVVATFTWFLADRLLLSRQERAKIPDLSTVLLPQFERNVRTNAKRLSKTVERAFNDAIAPTQALTESRETHHPVQAELNQIIAELTAMIQ